MLYQAPADIVAGMRAKLQIAGIPFNKAQGVSPRDCRQAAESDEAFQQLIRRLTPKDDRLAD